MRMSTPSHIRLQPAPSPPSANPDSTPRPLSSARMPFSAQQQQKDRACCDDDALYINTYPLRAFCFVFFIAVLSGLRSDAVHGTAVVERSC